MCVCVCKSAEHMLGHQPVTMSATNGGSGVMSTASDVSTVSFGVVLPLCTSVKYYGQTCISDVLNGCCSQQTCNQCFTETQDLSCMHLD